MNTLPLPRILKTYYQVLSGGVTMTNDSYFCHSFCSCSSLSRAGVCKAAWTLDSVALPSCSGAVLSLSLCACACNALYLGIFHMNIPLYSCYLEQFDLSQMAAFFSPKARDCISLSLCDLGNTCSPAIQPWNPHWFSHTVKMDSLYQGRVLVTLCSSLPKPWWSSATFLLTCSPSVLPSSCHLPALWWSEPENNQPISHQAVVCNMNMSKLKTVDIPFADIIMYPPASKSHGTQNEERATTDDGGEGWVQRSGISAARSWGQGFRFQHPRNKPGIPCSPVTPALGEGVRGRRSWDVFVSSLAKKMWTLGETVSQRNQCGEIEENSNLIFCART